MAAEVQSQVKPVSRGFSHGNLGPIQGSTTESMSLMAAYPPGLLKKGSDDQIALSIARANKRKKDRQRREQMQKDLKNSLGQMYEEQQLVSSIMELDDTGAIQYISNIANAKKKSAKFQALKGDQNESKWPSGSLNAAFKMTSPRLNAGPLSKLNQNAGKKAENSKLKTEKRASGPDDDGNHEEDHSLREDEFMDADADADANTLHQNDMANDVDHESDTKRVHIKVPFDSSSVRFKGSDPELLPLPNNLNGYQPLDKTATIQTVAHSEIAKNSIRDMLKLRRDRLEKRKMQKLKDKARQMISMKDTLNASGGDVSGGFFKDQSRPESRVEAGGDYNNGNDNHSTSGTSSDNKNIFPVLPLVAFTATVSLHQPPPFAMHPIEKPQQGSANTSPRRSGQDESIKVSGADSNIASIMPSSSSASSSSSSFPQKTSPERRRRLREIEAPAAGVTDLVAVARAKRAAHASPQWWPQWWLLEKQHAQDVLQQYKARYDDTGLEATNADAGDLAMGSSRDTTNNKNDDKVNAHLGGKNSASKDPDTPTPMNAQAGIHSSVHGSLSSRTNGCHLDTKQRQQRQQVYSRTFIDPESKTERVTFASVKQKRAALKESLEKQLGDLKVQWQDKATQIPKNQASFWMNQVQRQLHLVKFRKLKSIDHPNPPDPGTCFIVIIVHSLSFVILSFFL
jgi:hypothetical protein